MFPHKESIIVCDKANSKNFNLHDGS